MAILTIGILSYFACAWYGLKGSNLDKLPPHYTHLRQKLEEPTHQQEDHEGQIEELTY